MNVIPEFLSSFYSGYAVQDHTNFAEIADIRDADNVTDNYFFQESIKMVTNSDYWKAKALDGGSSGIWVQKTLWLNLFMGSFFLTG